MTLAFDISSDELPIFLSEVDEHLQTLDEVLIQLESLHCDQNDLQAVFRAAHTLKGMAGVINHARMVNVTHAMETVLDRVRKGEMDISSDLIDACLDAVDSLRALRDEVSTGEESDLDLSELLRRLELEKAAPVDGEAETEPPYVLAGEPLPEAAAEPGLYLYDIHASIHPQCIASAARAFQLMLALQGLGSIVEMTPTQAQIESAAPVRLFHATLSTGCAAQDLQNALGEISEVEGVRVTPLGLTGAPEPQTGAEPETPKPTAPARKNSDAVRADLTIRTSVERLDTLMELVGELITDRNHLSQLRGQMEHTRSADTHFEQLTETVAHLSRITDQLQEEVMRIRMLPVSNVFHKFPRIVRDLAQKTGKKVDLVIRGEDTELDRSVIEEINDPLIHLLRNAVDHGIEMPEERVAAGKPERGRILISARHEQGRILLCVEDDGHGIDVERLRGSAVARGLISEEEARVLPEDKALELIFLSGLSTASQVTDLSGRGVGMDIVRNNIQRINGNILIETKPGQGTQFQITLPLTLAIVPTLLVRVGATTFAIPVVMVAETLKLTGSEVQTIRGKPVTLLRNAVLPLVYIRKVFGIHASQQHSGHSYAVVVYYGKQQVGLVVDRLMGEEDVVVKSIGSLIGDVPGISSATILGDGSVALIVDVAGLLKAAEANG